MTRNASIRTLCIVVLGCLACAGAMAQIPGEDWERIAVLAENTTVIAPSPSFASDGYIFVGTGGHGVWRSDDSGDTWVQSTSHALLAQSRVTDLVIDPNFNTSEDNLFAITEDGYIFECNNATGSFTFAVSMTPPSSDARGRALAIHPDFYTDPWVFAGYEGDGIYVTDNGGTTWVQDTGSIVGFPYVLDLAISPTYGADNDLYCAGYGDSISCSVRKGYTSGSYYARYTGLGLEQDEVVTTLLYVGGDVIWAGTRDNGMYTSTDGGLNWSAGCDGVTDHSVPQVAAIGRAMGSAPPLIEGRVDGPFESPDDGATCSPGAPMVPIQDVEYQPGWDGSSECYVFYGTPVGLFRVSSCSQPSGRGPEEVDGYCCAVPPGITAAFMGSKGQGLFKSRFGTNMVRYNNFPNGQTPQIAAICPSPLYDESFEYTTETCGSQDESILFVAANFPDSPHDSGVYKSVDFGNTWSKLTGGEWPAETDEVQPVLHDLAISPNYLEGGSDMVLFAGTSLGLYRWGGSSWYFAWDVVGMPVYAVGLTPSYDPTGGTGWPYDTVFVSTDFSGDNIVAVSHNNGDKGQWLQTGYDGANWGRVTAFAFPYNQDSYPYVFVSALEMPTSPVGGSGGVYASLAMGTSNDWPTWGSRSSGLPADTSVFDLAAEPRFYTSGQRMICATDAGVGYTTDAGLSWSSSGTGNAYSVCFDPADTSGSYAMSGYQSGGAGLSSDGGEHFYSSLAFTGYGFLPDDVWATVAHERDENIVFASSPSMGVFVSEDKGVSFRPWNRGRGGTTGPCVLRTGMGLNMLANRRTGTNLDSVWAGTTSDGIKTRWITFDGTSVDLETEEGSTTNGWRFCRWDTTAGPIIDGEWTRIEVVPGTAQENPIWAVGSDTTNSREGFAAIPASNWWTVFIHQNSGYSGSDATDSREGYDAVMEDGSSTGTADVLPLEWDFYQVEVPAGVQDLQCYMTQISGVSDMHVRYGAQPTLAQYDYRPYLYGSDEEVCVQAILSEGFEGTWGPYGDNPPSGWSIWDYGDETTPEWNENDWYPYAKGGDYGTVARIYWTPTENTDDWLVSPAFDLPAGYDTLNLEFDHYFRQFHETDRGTVYLRSDQTPSWTPLAVYSDTTGDMDHESLPLDAYAGETTVQVAFRFVIGDGLGYNWDVDNVAVTGSDASESQFLVPGVWHIGIHGYTDHSINEYDLATTFDTGCTPSKKAGGGAEREKGSRDPAGSFEAPTWENLPEGEAYPARIPKAPSASAAWGTVSGTGVLKGTGSVSKSLPGAMATTWASCNGSTSPLTNLDAQTIVQLDNEDLVVGCDGDIFFSPGGDCEDVWYSATADVADPGGNDFRDLIEAPNGDVLIAAHGTGTGSSAGGVWLSGDHGRNWMRISSGFDTGNQELQDIMVDGASPPQYYSSTDTTGVYTRTITASSYPVVDSLSSSSCPETGGASAITVYGSNFSEECPTGLPDDCGGVTAPTVIFGDCPEDPLRRCEVTATFIDSMELTVTPPVHDPGTVKVSVRNPDTRRSRGGPSFTFQTCPGAPAITDITDDDGCAQSGITITFSVGNGAYRHDLVRDGGTVATGISSPFSYDPGSTTPYTYEVRAKGLTCDSDSGTYGFGDEDGTPSTPSISAITDDDPCDQSGVRVYYDAGAPATRHDLYDGGSLAVTNYVSGALYDPEDTDSHGYHLVAVNGSCTANSAAEDFTDADDQPSDPSITSIDDDDACAQSGIRVYYNAGGPATRHDLLRDGTPVATDYASGDLYDPGDALSHGYRVEAVNGSCSAVSGALAFTDENNQPSNPAITSVTDEDECAQSGIRVYYTAGTPATRHDLLRNGTPVVTDYTSGDLYDPMSTGSYNYRVSAVNGTCTAVSPLQAFADAAGQPSTPTIDSIDDNNVCAQNGIRVTYTAASPATRHDLIRDGMPVVLDYASNELYDPGNSMSFDYRIRAVNGTCTTYSTTQSFSDADNTPTPTISGPAANTCPSETVTLTTEPAMSAYQWYRDGSPIGGATTDSLFVTLSGNYFVSYVSGGCGGISAGHAVTITPCSAPPAPDGSGGTAPVEAARGASSTQILLTWDAVTCPAPDYNVLYGSLANVSAYTLDGADCTPDASGSYTWEGVPAGDLYFIVVGANGVMESSWGTDGTGSERNGALASGYCGVTTKDTTTTCP